MHLFTAEARILDVYDLQEGDRIVTFLTAEQGKKRGVARGSRRKHSRFAGQLQLLAKVRVTWYEREGRDLARISSADLLHSPSRAMRDLEGLLLASYLAEHLTEFAQENEDSERLCRLLEATLEALAAGLDRELVTRYFEVWILRLAGIFPPPLECPQCGREFRGEAVLPEGGDALLCRDCHAGPRGFSVAGPAFEFLLASAREPVKALAGKTPGTALAVVEDLCGRLRRRFLGRELKSYRVMQRSLTLAGGESNS